MARDALAAMQHLDGIGAVAQGDLAAHQRVRHRVVVAVEFDVVVDVHARLLPLAEPVGLGRQRAQRRRVELLEGAAA